MRRIYSKFTDEDLELERKNCRALMADEVKGSIPRKVAEKRLAAIHEEILDRELAARMARDETRQRTLEARRVQLRREELEATAFGADEVEALEERPVDGAFSTEGRGA